MMILKPGQTRTLLRNIIASNRRLKKYLPHQRHKLPLIGLLYGIFSIKTHYLAVIYIEMGHHCTSINYIGSDV